MKRKFGFVIVFDINSHFQWKCLRNFNLIETICIEKSRFLISEIFNTTNRFEYRLKWGILYLFIYLLWSSQVIIIIQDFPRKSVKIIKQRNYEWLNFEDTFYILIKRCKFNSSKKNFSLKAQKLFENFLRKFKHNRESFAKTILKNKPKRV